MDRNFENRYKRAIKNAKRSDDIEPRAAKASYDAKKRRVIVELTNGTTFIFPPSLAQGLANASAKELKDVSVTPSGEGLRWEVLDADFSIPALLMGIFGSKAWMSELGRQGGRSRTEAKMLASRENGRKGGRPRKYAAR